MGEINPCDIRAMVSLIQSYDHTKCSLPRNRRQTGMSKKDCSCLRNLALTSHLQENF